MVYNLLKNKFEGEMKRVFDIRTLKSSTWVGIILRNIPSAQGSEKEQIKSILNGSLKKFNDPIMLTEQDISNPI